MKLFVLLPLIILTVFLNSTVEARTCGLIFGVEKTITFDEAIEKLRGPLLDRSGSPENYSFKDARGETVSLSAVVGLGESAAEVYLTEQPSTVLKITPSFYYDPSGFGSDSKTSVVLSEYLSYLYLKSLGYDQPKFLSFSPNIFAYDGEPIFVQREYIEGIFPFEMDRLLEKGILIEGYPIKELGSHIEKYKNDMQGYVEFIEQFSLSIPIEGARQRGRYHENLRAIIHNLPTGDGKRDNWIYNPGRGWILNDS